MYKRASFPKHKITHEDQGSPTARFTVMAFYTRPDNQGNARLFRLCEHFRKLQSAKDWYQARVNRGKHLYVVLVRMSTMDAMLEHGDPEVEDHWLEYNAPGADLGICNLSLHLYKEW